MRVLDRVDRDTKPANELPHSLEAERAVIGALLIEPAAIDLVANYLKASDFHSGAHALTYQTLLDMSVAGTPIDEATIVQELRRLGRLENVGGAGYVADFASTIPTAANVEWYARQILDHSHVRAAHKALEVAREHLLTSTDPAHQRLENVERIVSQATQQQSSKGEQSLTEILQETLAGYYACREGGVPGVPTGYPMLDRMTHGFRPGEVSIIAGRPGTGKSTFAINLMKNAAHKGKACLFLSLEMTNSAVATSLACAMGRIDKLAFHGGYLSPGEEQRLIDWFGEVERLPIAIHSPPGSMSLMGVRSLARRHKAAKKLDVLFLDYLQLMEAPDGSRRARHEQVSEMSRGLKALAVELNVPIVALSQLNRTVEERQGNRPKPSDLRESGSLEQDAALVLLLYREEVKKGDDRQDKNAATLIVGKNRYGPVGDVPLHFDYSTAYFGPVETRQGPA